MKNERKFIVALAGDTEAVFTEETEAGSGVMVPTLYNTREDAEKGITDHLKDVAEAVRIGNMDAETQDTREDYDIVEVRQFRVEASVTTHRYLDVWAHDEDEARRIGEMTDGEHFTPDDDPSSGSWDITGVSEVNTDQPE